VKRIILCLAIGVGALASTQLALADDKPTKEQLDQAKAAFAEGKSLHDQGKLTEAVEKFKESYRLSKNPLLLYNIGLTLDEAGQKDNALLYYRKFLADAPANAGQRPTATERVKVLEKEKLEADLNGTPTKTEPVKTEPVKTEPVKTEPVKTEPVKPVKIKPPGTYKPEDFQHQSVDSAPPGKPLDVTAFVPEDSGWSVLLFYRAAGDATFTSKTMKWRYKELVARIPAATMKGNTIQYYIEVKDQAGNKVTSAGKSTNPNLVTIEAGAAARFYPDMADDDGKLPNVTTSSGGGEENPLAGKGGGHDENPIGTPIGNGDQKDTGGVSSNFKYYKWGATGAAAVLLGTGIATYFMAKNQANNIQNDLVTPGCSTPPCRSFDKFDIDFQNAGQNYQTISNVTIALGVVSAGVAGYLWYKESKQKAHDDGKTGASAATGTTWIVTPAVSEHFTGAAAAAMW
jgi:hypothetical protein